MGEVSVLVDLHVMRVDETAPGRKSGALCGLPARALISIFLVRLVPPGRRDRHRPRRAFLGAAGGAAHPPRDVLKPRLPAADVRQHVRGGAPLAEA